LSKTVCNKEELENILKPLLSALRGFLSVNELLYKSFDDEKEQMIVQSFSRFLKINLELIGNFYALNSLNKDAVKDNEFRILKDIHFSLKNLNMVLKSELGLRFEDANESLTLLKELKRNKAFDEEKIGRNVILKKEELGRLLSKQKNSNLLRKDEIIGMLKDEWLKTGVILPKVEILEDQKVTFSVPKFFLERSY